VTGFLRVAKAFSATGRFDVVTGKHDDRDVLLGKLHDQVVGSLAV
jgi:hypothetical protein